MKNKVIIGFGLLVVGVVCAMYGYSMDTDGSYQFAKALGHSSPVPGIFMLGGILIAAVGLIMIFMGVFSSNESTSPAVAVESKEEREERLNREAEQSSLREEEMRRQREEEERREEENRRRREEFWRRHRTHIISAIVAVVICIVAGCIVTNILNERNRRQAEQKRQEQYECQLQEKVQREEVERQAREEEHQRRLETEQQARNEEAEAKCRQEAAAETAKREMEERHKQGIYHIGELYEKNGVRGIVFSTDQAGSHGKIISFEEERISYNDAYRRSPWYLPSKEDMDAIRKYLAIVNKGLKNAGAVPMTEGRGGYWLYMYDRGTVWYYIIDPGTSDDGKVSNCTETDVRSKPYIKQARWVCEY